MLKELMEIERLLDKAQDIYNTLSNKEQIKLNGFHTEMYSLNHCLRWGLQAAQENIADIFTMIRWQANL